MYNHHYYLILELFMTPKRNTIPIKSHSLLSLPWTLTTITLFLSLLICLLWIFHINRIVQYGAFGV